MIDYKIEMTAYCDGCKTRLAYATVGKLSDADSTRWRWHRMWKNTVLMRPRRYGQPLLYCVSCADGAPKKKQRTEKKDAANDYET